MVISEEKSKCMIFNFTKKYKFSTRLNLNNKNLEVVNSTRLLGTYITQDLRWDLNTSNLVKKASMRLQLLVKIASFGAPIDDLKIIYMIFDIQVELKEEAVMRNVMIISPNF